MGWLFWRKRSKKEDTTGGLFQKNQQSENMHGDVKKERAWAILQQRYDLCLSVGAQQFMSTTPHMEQAFAIDKEERWLGCDDEGVTVMREHIPGSPVHLIGSGIFLEGSAIVAEIVKRNKWKRVTSHPGCGGAAHFGGDAVGEEFAREVARQAGVLYQRIEVAWMRRPPAFHNAYAIYYDGTGDFNWGGVSAPGLLPGFVVSRHYCTAAYAETEVERLFAIATGEHGWGSLFTEETPLLLIAIADPRTRFFSAAQLCRELDAIQRKLGLRVKVDSYIPSFLQKR